MSTATSVAMYPSGMADQTPVHWKEFDESALELYAAAKRICFTIVRNEEDAEDLAQTAMLKATNAIDRFKGESALKTWVIRIAVNESLMFLRDRKHFPLDAIGEITICGADGNEAAMEAINNILDPSTDQATLFSREEFQTYLLHCISELPPIYREVLTLRFFHDHSVQECARLLSISEGAGKSRMLRARHAVANALSARGYISSASVL